MWETGDEQNDNKCWQSSAVIVMTLLFVHLNNGGWIESSLWNHWNLCKCKICTTFDHHHLGDEQRQQWMQSCGNFIEMVDKDATFLLWIGTERTQICKHQAAITRELIAVAKEDYSRGFQHLYDRFEKCITSSKEYFKRWVFFVNI